MDDCYNNADDMVKTVMNCYDYLTMEWKNDGDCQNAHEDFKDFRDKECVKFIFAVNWNNTKDGCEFESSETLDVRNNLIKPCFDFNDIVIKVSKACEEAFENNKKHFQKCVLPPEFEPKRPETIIMKSLKELYSNRNIEMWA